MTAIKKIPALTRHFEYTCMYLSKLISSHHLTFQSTGFRGLEFILIWYTVQYNLYNTIQSEKFSASCQQLKLALVRIKPAPRPGTWDNDSIVYTTLILNIATSFIIIRKHSFERYLNSNTLHSYMSCLSFILIFTVST